MKRFIGVILALIIVLGTISVYAGSRADEVETLTYILEKSMEDVSGVCKVYSGVEYFEDIEVMLVSISYYVMEYLPPSQVCMMSEIFYDLFDSTTAGLTQFTDCKIALLVKESNNQLWIIDTDGIYDCVVGELIDLRKT